MNRTPTTNLVWLHSHFLFWMGGTKFVYEVLKQLQSDTQLQSITVIVDRVSPSVRDMFRRLNVDIVELGGPTSTHFVYWLFLPVLNWLRAHQVRRIQIDRGLRANNTIVVSSMFPMNAVAKLIGYRHIQNCYEPFAFFYDHEFIAKFPLLKRVAIKLLGLVYRSLDIAATQSAAVVLTLNSVTQKLIAETYARRSVLTQAGVDTSLFRPFVSTEIRSRYKNKKIVIHSTDYSPVKGTDRVLHAMKEVVAQEPTAHLLITSTLKNERAQQALQNLAQELGIASHCSFLGFVPIDELPQLYAMAVVLVQGSSSERSGTTSMALPVKEAMCCGTTAIRPSAGSEDTVDGQTGYICDPRDTARLAKLIVNVLADTRRAKKMGLQARNFISARYSWPATANVFALTIQYVSSRVTIGCEI